MLGSYSYKTGNERRLAFTPPRATLTDPVPARIYFKVMPVNANIAAIQFHADQTFANVVAPPPQFALRDSTGQPVPAFQNNFLIVWLESYVLSWNAFDVLIISNQKQQSMAANGGLAAAHAILEFV